MQKKLVPAFCNVGFEMELGVKTEGGRRMKKRKEISEFHWYLEGVPEGDIRWAKRAGEWYGGAGNGSNLVQKKYPDKMWIFIVFSG